MYSYINFPSFCDAFKDFGRFEQFSYEGLRALFDYLEDFEASTDTKIELDVIALCLDYSEYENLQDLQASYPDISTMEQLEDHTQVIHIPNSESIIISNF